VNIVVRYRGDEYEVAVGSGLSDMTVGDLVAPWCEHTDPGIAVGGYRIDPMVPLAELGLRSGASLDVVPVDELAAVPALRRIGATAVGHGVFNRPPRVLAKEAREPLDLPSPPPQPAKAMRFAWAALVVPVVLGAAMAVLIHPRMAMFAVFSPVMLLANWLEDRRRLRKERKTNGAASELALARFAAAVATLYRRDIDRRSRLALRPAQLVERAVAAHVSLWERRLNHADFMQIPVGTGCVPWRPELNGTATPEATAILDEYADLHDVPIVIGFNEGDVTGIAGSRSAILASARQIVLQAAFAHGPADLSISVFTERAADWDWAKWLPHVMVSGSDLRRLAGTEAEIGEVVRLLPDSAGTGAAAARHLLVVDLPDLVAGDRGAIRQALRSGLQRGISGLALAPRPVDLPSVVTTIAAIGDRDSRIRFADGDVVALAPWCMTAPEARTAARALAQVEDPEVSQAGSELPTTLHLLSLLGLGDSPDEAIAAAWGGNGYSVAAPIGMTPDGPLRIDLVGDGPHALVGGTTGAGKSELLRTLVAGLAANTSPLALNFVLIDYKGGSAFDACAAFPHTVGLVTDLDDRLARRALTCLEAELRYRERSLRELGASDIAEATIGGLQRLPRLLVVVDEFAALAKELPDFMEALIDVAQRGRSLGVHLLLATQRPNGVISDSIRANTNLRIALRMQDAADSSDVVGCADAAAINRNQPGRGLARRGPGEVVPFQAALVTASSQGGRMAASCPQPFVFAHEQSRPREATTTDSEVASDLEQIVAASVRVAAQQELPPARLPWPAPLANVYSRRDVPAEPADCEGTVFAIADEPHRQRRVPAAWSPASGNMLFYGLPGSGTTTAVASLVEGLADDCDPDGLHIYVLDFDDQALLPLQALPHVGAVVGAQERERQVRLLGWLSGELGDRRAAVGADTEALAGRPTIVTFLDNYSGFVAAFDEPGEMSIRSLLTQLVADGPGVGIMTIVTAKHPGDVPTPLASLVANKLAFRLADRYDYSALGIPPVDPPTLPGRAFESGSGREIQVLLPHREGPAAAVAANRWAAPQVAPVSVEILPRRVAVSEVVAAGRVSPQEWFLPLGIGNTALAPAGLVLREGDHALITGPARSGKSTALATVAAVARAAYPQLSISALLPRRSPLAGCRSLDRVLAEDQLARFIDEACMRLLLVDDAELVDDCSLLSELVRGRQPDMHIVAAGSADALRALYGHWTQDVRRSRIGCALRPNVAADGDLWQTALPRQGPQRFPTGRGYLLADGEVELVQLGHT